MNSNRSQMMPNVVGTSEWHTDSPLSVSMMFLSPSDDYCDLLLNRPMATWNLFVFFFNKEEAKIDNDDVISSSVL